MGHEYVGIVEEVGDQDTTVSPGQFVIGSFATSDNTCPNCRNGYQSACVHREFMTTCQAEYVRIPHADGTLVATEARPDAGHIPSLLTLSDVMGTAGTPRSPERPLRPCRAHDACSTRDPSADEHFPMTIRRVRRAGGCWNSPFCSAPGVGGRGPTLVMSMGRPCEDGGLLRYDSRFATALPVES